MERKEGRSYKITWLFNIIKHGLFWHGIRNRMARIGIDIMPYYWVREGHINASEPQIRSETSNFSLSFLNEKDISDIKQQIIGIDHKDLKTYLNQGQLCIGLKQDHTIAAYMFAKTGHYEFRGKKFNFEANEAYLHSMYTFEAFRGKNMAPYLRYKSYELLKESGYTIFYSISEYFNKSTIKFKKKLNAEHLYLYLSILLFNKIKWHFKLKTIQKL